MVEKNKVYTAGFDDYTVDGMAIAHIRDTTVFVPNAAVGDQCDIKIVKISGKIAYGRIERLLVPSKHRIEPACSISASCGGCCYQHISYEEELRIKQKKVADALRRIGGIEIVPQIVGAPQIAHYRNKAQYPVGMGEHGVISGFYRGRSHEIMPTDTCVIQSKTADLLAAIVRRWMDLYHISPYDEKSGKGFIRHIYVRIGESSGESHLCMVSTKAKIPHTADLLSMLQEECPSLTGVVININKRTDNVILGDSTFTLWGAPELQDSLCGHIFRLSPHAFYQVNHEQTERLYACALEFAELSGKETVIDLYCGAGTITLLLAEHAKRVIGVEIVPEAVENARENAERNGIKNVEFICADAGQAAMVLAERQEKPDVLSVDPPRKGLDAMTIGAIERIAPPKIVYVSCDPATLARDLKLLGNARYSVENIRAYDMFPRTKHVETVVLLSHKNPQTSPPSL